MAMHEPLIYSPDEPAEAADAQPVEPGPTLRHDEERHPWLRGMDERALANLAVDLTTFLCRPSFGARTKREIEFEVFARLRDEHPDWSTLGRVADDLAITRSRARTLVLEYRARQVGSSGVGARAEILRAEILSWPSKQVEVGDRDELRIVIDDPFVRDLLKNHAYAQGVLLDQSFASEIQSFSWDSYARLVVSLYTDGTKLLTDDFLTFTADMRRQVQATRARSAAAWAELQPKLDEIEKLAQKARKSSEEKRRELALQIIKQYGPIAASAALKAVAGWSVSALAGTGCSRNDSCAVIRGPGIPLWLPAR